MTFIACEYFEPKRNYQSNVKLNVNCNSFIVLLQYRLKNHSKPNGIHIWEFNLVSNIRISLFYIENDDKSNTVRVEQVNHWNVDGKLTKFTKYIPNQKYSLLFLEFVCEKVEQVTPLFHTKIRSLLTSRNECTCSIHNIYLIH